MCALSMSSAEWFLRQSGPSKNIQWGKTEKLHTCVFYKKYKFLANGTKVVRPLDGSPEFHVFKWRCVRYPLPTLCKAKLTTLNTFEGNSTVSPTIHAVECETHEHSMVDSSTPPRGHFQKILESKQLEKEILLKETIFLKLSQEVENLTTQLKEKTDALLKLNIEIQNLKDVCLVEFDLESLKMVIHQNNETILDGENTRRHMHNEIMELKGNIRVFCRVRPLMNKEHSLKISFPESNDRCIELVRCDDPTDTKKRGNNKFAFTFDHVFDSSKTQEHVFEEVSQLVQSALDGYNVCVFAYGQTGSGKTFTMEGGLDHDQQSLGMIPRTVSQMFDSMKRLESYGWTYEMTASFIEIYNENIRDLLGDPNIDKKHEIKMVDTKGSDVYVTNINVINIQSEKQVLSLLSQAQKNRVVAATKCNERSSRSHSVFQLCLTGKNYHVTESCQGVLSLVDLAGSERLKESQSQGARLNETKSINKSLSNLSTVIMSLSQKAEHIPFRNSKLTHLLMNSLGGNSKTLMLVNVSPSEESFNETINSLRFATKVNECKIRSIQKGGNFLV